MQFIRRNAKVSSLLLLTTGILVVLLLSFSQSLVLGRASAVQDEKKAEKTKPAAKDEGSVEKKDEPGSALEKFMRQKLHASNEILEGLCTEDMQMVSDGAVTLMKMGTEERWRVSNDMLYRRYSREFNNAVEELQTAADDIDMNGASMAWVNVTMKCLKCHEWVRNTVLAEAEK